jgi:hypothetical protein
LVILFSLLIADQFIYRQSAHILKNGVLGNFNPATCPDRQLTEIPAGFKVNFRGAGFTSTWIAFMRKATSRESPL